MAMGKLLRLWPLLAVLASGISSVHTTAAATYDDAGAITRTQPRSLQTDLNAGRVLGQLSHGQSSWTGELIEEEPEPPKPAPEPQPDGEPTEEDDTLGPGVDVQTFGMGVVVRAWLPPSFPPPLTQPTHSVILTD
jgi:hypothetical protein|eukprot:SAG25_NODE_1479_length_2939_cov_6.003522_4_plen_135_part_00